MHYKGGGWRSPGRAKLFCDRCCREYDPVTLVQRENFHWVRNGDRLVYSYSRALGEANMAAVWGQSDEVVRG